MPLTSRRKAGTGESVNPSPVSTLPHVHQIVLPTPWLDISVQVYLVDAEPLTLIDTGVKSPPSLEALQDGFTALGRELSGIERIIVTHFHTDHMGQAQSIRDAGARLELCAHEIEAPLIESGPSRRMPMLEDRVELFVEYGVPRKTVERYAEAERRYQASGAALYEKTRVDRRCRSGDRVGFDGFELTVLHAPGHTAGHLVLFEERSGTLFTGDHIMGAECPFTDAYYVGNAPDAEDPLAQRPRLRGLSSYLKSLRELHELDPRTILPAHGGIVHNPRRAIESARRFYESRVRRVRQVLDDLTREQGEATAWEIWNAMFPGARAEPEIRRRMLMVIGALDVLEEDGACRTARREDGVLVHAAASWTS